MVASHLMLFNCRECIYCRLEGKGITKSECPECHQPAWRKDLVFNNKYASIVDLLKGKKPC